MWRPLRTFRGDKADVGRHCDQLSTKLVKVNISEDKYSHSTRNRVGKRDTHLAKTALERGYLGNGII